MEALAYKRVLVLGLGSRGVAACRLLQRLGATAIGLDARTSPELEKAGKDLRGSGIEIHHGVAAPSAGKHDLAVLTPEASFASGLIQAVRSAGIPCISELELGLQHFHCLTIAVSGTNGKSTTTELVERVLTANHRRTLIAGHPERPACSVAEQTKELDYVILNVDASQLQATEFIRPAVAVMLNAAPDLLPQSKNAEDYARVNGRLFQKQQAFDWAIVQNETLAWLRSLNVPVPAKTISFSAHDSTAELHLERGLVLSRLPNWSGPLVDMDACRIKGPHNAENIMAALAVGHVLRLPLESMLDAVKTYASGPHRFEKVAEINGVSYFNDAKANNLNALRNALLAAPRGERGEANVWLIARGQEQGADYHALGPLLCNRVKRAFLLGGSETLRAAWALFTPCTPVRSLLEAVHEAARNAVSGDVVLLSPACSDYDEFRDYKQMGESFCSAVKSISGGVLEPHHNMDGRT